MVIIKVELVCHTMIMPEWPPVGPNRGTAWGPFGHCHGVADHLT